MESYLVRMYPWEPYTFGTEQKIAYPGEEKTGKESYFIQSALWPEQTTILGMLRYLILSEQGLLHTDFSYTPEEQERMAEAVGKSSFSFLEKSRQSFGLLGEISPMFLINEKGEYLVPNPFCNTSSGGFEPMKMGTEIDTDMGLIRLPAAKSYIAKNGYASGYFNLSTREAVAEKNIFRRSVISHNRKNEKQSEDDCFFRQEIITLEKGYCFAVFVKAQKGALPGEAAGYMGQKKSAFRVLAEPREEDIYDKIKAAFRRNGDIWFYAFSDLMVDDAFRPDSFAIVEEKQIRNLETVYQGTGRLRRSSMQFHLVKRGSVFWGSRPSIWNSENGWQIGYNHIIQLGGE